MNAKSRDMCPVSVIPMSLEHSGGELHHQQSGETEVPGSAELSNECIWILSTAAKVGDCAAEMRRRITEKLLKGDSAYSLPGDACLARPILDRYLGDIPSEVLLGWVHFNPYRPIISTLWYVELPGSTEGLLTFFKEDPFQKQNGVFALIPGQFNLPAIGQAATALFAANGHESCVMFQGLPTSISHSENWVADTTAPLFGSKLAKELFRYPAVRCWRTTDMLVFCDHLRRFPDPWERAEAALDHRKKVAAGTQVPHLTDFCERAFDEWFELITDPVHAESGRQNFGAAREGARLLYERCQSARKQEGASHHDSK